MEEGLLEVVDHVAEYVALEGDEVGESLVVGGDERVADFRWELVCESGVELADGGGGVALVCVEVLDGEDDPGGGGAGGSDADSGGGEHGV